MVLMKDEQNGIQVDREWTCQDLVQNIVGGSFSDSEMIDMTIQRFKKATKFKTLRAEGERVICTLGISYMMGYNMNRTTDFSGEEVQVFKDLMQGFDPKIAKLVRPFC